MKTHNSIEERFQFTGNTKTLSLVAVVIGVIAIAFGFILGGEHVQSTYSNLLLMSYYFVCVCLAGVFFCAYQYAAQAGWSAAFIRIPQAMAKVLPIASVILIVIVTFGLFTTHEVVEHGKKEVVPYLYAHWATHGLTIPGSENFDPIIAGKAAFLNIKFFYGMLIVLLGAYSYFGLALAKCLYIPGDIWFDLPNFCFWGYHVIRGTLVLNHVWLVQPGGYARKRFSGNSTVNYLPAEKRIYVLVTYRSFAQYG
jgi:vacuolar-type H+-ATPase subunit I/STV1